MQLVEDKVHQYALVNAVTNLGLSLKTGNFLIV
jgi:hypothetical protein